MGPVCAKHLGITRPTTKSEIEEFNKKLKEKIEEMGEFEFWVPKSQIKNAMGKMKYILRVLIITWDLCPIFFALDFS